MADGADAVPLSGFPLLWWKNFFEMQLFICLHLYYRLEQVRIVGKLYWVLSEYKSRSGA